MTLQNVDALLGRTVTGIYMIRFLLPDGEPIYTDDPIIVDTQTASLCFRAKAECLIVEDKWIDPFSSRYVMGNPVYPSNIVQMRNEIGGNYIIDVSKDIKFSVYQGKSICSYRYIKNPFNQVVGVVLYLDQLPLTFVVMGEECMINPARLPEGFQVVESNI
ncbi:hypothetical protein DAETH_16740 [Deinococcus aetherius]|uniref:Uncharacterized protein n=1 Tax=Deinococcus aetherius TaxID=200252 RepID=A0ABM8AD37_9DEIO|nr:hypothetical protein DAETH_16740 [Deinococcus aetherius]